MKQTLKGFIEHSQNLVGADKSLTRIETSTYYQDEVKELKEPYNEAKVVLSESKRNTIYLIFNS